MSSSRASTQANQTSSAADNRVAASDSAIALSAGATLIQDTLADDVAIAAIRAGENIGETASVTARGINADSLSFARGLVETTSGIADRAIDTVAGSIAGIASNAISNLEKNKRDADADTIQTVGKYAAVAGVLIAAIFFFRRK